jgi:hypothetical protein
LFVALEETGMDIVMVHGLLRRVAAREPSMRSTDQRRDMYIYLIVAATFETTQTNIAWLTAVSAPASTTYRCASQDVFS